LFTQSRIKFYADTERFYLGSTVNNVSAYHQKTLILRSGERLPMLLDDLGVPVYGPTVFALAEVRNRHRASNTIANALAALSIFQRFLDETEVNLDSRMNEGKLLELGEIEGLVRTCRMDLSKRGGRKANVLLRSVGQGLEPYVDTSNGWSRESCWPVITRTHHNCSDCPN